MKQLLLLFIAVCCTTAIPACSLLAIDPMMSGRFAVKNSSADLLREVTFSGFQYNPGAGILPPGITKVSHMSEQPIPEEFRITWVDPKDVAHVAILNVPPPPDGHETMHIAIIYTQEGVWTSKWSDESVWSH